MSYNKHLIIFIFFVVGIQLSYAQKIVTWKDLSHITFSEEYYSEYDEYYLTPKFEEVVKELEGKQIIITGYFLNIAPEENVYILSKTPMSACFFCGVGGPETAIELEFTNKPLFKTDKVVSVTGILKLNGTDVEHFNYILTSCTAKLANQSER
ncbi:hypothetical protein [Neptunitalea lumnitzerae]|uniref:DUF3299 domain-containing protein n=1 Tax=Neptunitalea lumnitzerae TaxID=2965509 RepID=A0ABQ5MK95_9FLAO|nr:hypothetical protein [Neptunitalea sp. Y10]GLB49819.1 hypothetical protein Y10_21870 [Neptunitalea sp. Y10]